MAIYRIQRLFAFRDYEGLDDVAKKELADIRNEEAQALWKKRQKIQAQRLKNNQAFDEAVQLLDKHYDPNKPGALNEQLKKMGKSQSEVNFINRVQNNSTAVKNSIENEWRSGYNDAMRKTNDTVNWDREDLLKDTQKRQNRLRTEQNLANQTPKNGAATNPSRVPTGKSTTTTVKNKGGVIGWIKNNPGKAAFGAVAATGLAYGGKKLYDRYKNKKADNT